MHIDKSKIIEILRSRGLHARADWVDRELPELVDTQKNRALLEMLGIDPAAISPSTSPRGKVDPRGEARTRTSAGA